MIVKLLVNNALWFGVCYFFAIRLGKPTDVLFVLPILIFNVLTHIFLNPDNQKPKYFNISNLSIWFGKYIIVYWVIQLMLLFVVEAQRNFYLIGLFCLQALLLLYYLAIPNNVQKKFYYNFANNKRYIKRRGALLALLVVVSLLIFWFDIISIRSINLIYLFGMVISLPVMMPISIMELFDRRKLLYSEQFLLTNNIRTRLKIGWVLSLIMCLATTILMENQLRLFSILTMVIYFLIFLVLFKDDKLDEKA